MNHKQVELGRQNLSAVRRFFETHLCATNRECGDALNLTEMAVGRHAKTLRKEWQDNPPLPAKRDWLVP